MVDQALGSNTSDFDNQTLAVLRGRLVRYLMRSREITVGRSTKDGVVDVDLGLEVRNQMCNNFVALLLVEFAVIECLV